MRIRSLVAASFTSLTVLVLLACSSSTKDPTPATAQDAATGTDASTDTTIAPAGPDPKTACTKLTAKNNATQPKLTLTAANLHPLAEAPTSGTGGTIVDGTYRMTAYDEYADANTGTTTEGGTIQFAGGLYEIVLPDPGAETGGGSYEITGSKIAYFFGCGGVSAGPSGAPSGGVGQKTNPMPFSATATTLTFIVANPSNSVVVKSVYTKD